MSAYEAVTTALAHVTGYTHRGAAGAWRCPAHDDRNPSLSVSNGGGSVKLHCHAGCPPEAVVAALGLEMRDLYDEPAADDAPRERSRVVAEYEYVDEQGRLLFVVERRSPKAFRQRRPHQDRPGEWIWNLGDVRRVPFRLPELLAAVEAGRPVWLTEGEKDALALVGAGECATTVPGGAQGWRDAYLSYFKRAAVRIVMDNDGPGAKYGRSAHDALVTVAQDVKLYRPPRAKDVADHLAGGLPLADLVPVTREQLERLCDPGSTPDPEPVAISRHAKSGARFVLDDPAELAPIWGRADEVLWASGEPCLVVGPPGVGKSTVAIQIVEGLTGIADSLLGYPIQPTARTLYLAMDRPRQIRRAMRRRWSEEHREILADRLVVWEGPLPTDLGKNPAALLELCQHVEATAVVIDSVKDAVIKLTDDEAGGNFNRAVQSCVAENIEVLALHHQRKGQNGAKPTTLEDVYGSTWITAGAGSVILLWGAPGDLIIEVRHLKQPAVEIGPLKVEHDHNAGASSIDRGQVDPLAVLRNAGPAGLDAPTLARLMFETGHPNDNQRRKAQRKLERLAGDGLAHKQGGDRGGMGGTVAARYFLVENRHPEM